MPELVIIIRLLVTAVLSGLIGFEREMHGRAAGLRTHILVGVGAALITLTSIHVALYYKGVLTADPSRIAMGVVTGIGFLGAGTIIRFRASVRGLTTAASLWAVAGIGLAVGSGLYIAAFVTAAIILISLFFLSKLESSLIRKDWYKVLCIETAGGAKQLEEIRAVLGDYNVEIKDFDIEKTDRPDIVNLDMNLKLMTDLENEQIIADIMGIEGVRRAVWK